MTAWFPRCALGASLILVSGCGPAQAIPTTAGAASADTREASPFARGQALLYYSGGNYGEQQTNIFSFPQGDLVGSFNGGGSLCPDNAGNVWVAGYPNGYSNKLAEFAHGGETPINTLTATQTRRVLYCAVDPTTGDLAAVGNRHHVFIFSGASAPAKVLRDHFYTGSCTYDSSGNLFILGFFPGHGNKIEISELPKGATRFEMRRDHIDGLNASSGLRWDGKHLTVGQGVFQGGHGLLRYSVLSNHLKSRRGVFLGGDFKALGDYWISGSYAVATSRGGGSGSGFEPVYLYNYPSGGYPVKIIGQYVVPYLTDASVTVSLAPK